MGFALTGGEALFGQGFVALACLDVSQGHPGVRRTGTFRPSEYVLRERYAGINIFDPIEYLPENNAGAHSSGLNSQAPALLPLVFERLGITIAPNPQRDALDLSLLVGATQWVIQKAIEFKLLEVAAPPAVVPPSPPVVGPLNLHDTFDGMIWAQEYVRLHGGDVELMHSWFANAIMAGYDHARREGATQGAGSGLHPLSPAVQRAEELRAMLVKGAFWLAPTPVIEKWVMVITGGVAWPTITGPLVVEALRLWRLLRKSRGDQREIPQEDR